MSIESEAADSGRRTSGRGSSVFTGVLVATLLIVGSVVSQVSAHDTGTTSHLWDHIKALREAGTINTDTNPLHWTKLKGVPAGLADGIDHTAGAGFGLNEVWGTLWVDPKEVQRRVTTACPSGQAIKSIRQDGTAVCAPVSQALSKTIANTGVICNAWCTEGSMPLSAGTWAITAKIVIEQSDHTEDALNVRCRLHAETVFDYANTVLIGVVLPDVTLPMQILATVPSGSGAYVDCLDQDVGDAIGHDLSIIAVRVGG